VDGISCDGCGAGLLIDASVRYVLKIEVFAAYDPLEITREDLERSGPDEMARLIETLEGRDPRELEEEVYKKFLLDLCPACQRNYVRDPLRFVPGESPSGGA
jgi:hypothetical protein